MAWLHFSLRVKQAGSVSTNSVPLGKLLFLGSSQHDQRGVFKCPKQGGNIVNSGAYKVHSEAGREVCPTVCLLFPAVSLRQRGPEFILEDPATSHFHFTIGHFLPLFLCTPIHSLLLALANDTLKRLFELKAKSTS